MDGELHTLEPEAEAQPSGIRTAKFDELDLLDAGEVAEFLRVRKPRVYELVRQKRIPHVRIGRQIRFIWGVLVEWTKKGGTGQ